MADHPDSRLPLHPFWLALVQLPALRRDCHAGRVLSVKRVLTAYSRAFRRRDSVWEAGGAPAILEIVGDNPDPLDPLTQAATQCLWNLLLSSVHNQVRWDHESRGGSTGRFSLQTTHHHPTLACYGQGGREGRADGREGGRGRGRKPTSRTRAGMHGDLLLPPFPPLRCRSSRPGDWICLSIC